MRLIRRSKNPVDEVQQISPRPLTAREESWLKEILGLHEEWKNANISRTLVVAEGPLDEGISLQLSAPEAENPGHTSADGLIGQIWINTTDNCAINIQLSHLRGHLRELYILFVDPKHPRRTLPVSWKELSHETHRA